MAWELRRNVRFYYRSRRCNGTVKKVYCGSGVVGQMAAEADAQRRLERQEQLAACQAQRIREQELQTLGRQLEGQCRLLADAVLLANGFHRPRRMKWRRWHAARREMQRCSCASNRG